ncbi:fatty-acyl-CoA synthase [Marinobacter daqiaonensis]|uniref:Fatty-acyl-CoA synthase n=1 Tax=Marinobacter daqiaonensis TaxID=650891 RepID=A0A1I6IN05_9GAMM|nr:class I adenylate-forming enzyme family protein [Marinobacter daqiaonensis]SFR68113.1 fatty-acyl-CoA synthase [Marinobacter daqiaonensis]
MALQERFLHNRWYHSTTQALFAEVCARQPDKPAIIFEDEEIPYRTLGDRVNQLSQGLLGLGVGKGDVVSMLPSPTPEFACLYFATLQVGAIINPLNLLWGVKEFQGVLPRNNPRVIVTVDHCGNRDYIQTLKSSIPDLQVDGERVSSGAVPGLSHLVCMSRQGLRHDGFLDFSELMGRGADWQQDTFDRLIRESRPTDIQFMCQTSGTTGLSKSALWDHRPPLATAHFGAKNLCYQESDAYINMSPFYHNSGLFGLNLNLTLAGSTLHLMEQFRPEQALKIIDRYKVTATFGFDSHWQGLLGAPGFSGYDFTISKAVLAGEPRSYDLVKDMCPEGATINNLYAQTENGPLVSLAEHDCMDYRIRKYTHGRPLAGVEVVIKDLETGGRVVQGQPGEICYRSPFLFRGYYRQEEETRQSFDEEGYFHSGDYGTFDNGYITFLGRLGGVLKTGGENVSTVRVTNLLLEIFQEAFDDAKTIGVPDEYWGSKIVAFVRPRTGYDLGSTRDIREACKGVMAIYEIPQEFLEWNGNWPVTPEGKIDFRKLDEEARSRLGLTD